MIWIHYVFRAFGHLRCSKHPRTPQQTGAVFKRTDGAVLTHTPGVLILTEAAKKKLIDSQQLPATVTGDVVVYASQQPDPMRASAGDLKIAYNEPGAGNDHANQVIDIAAGQFLGVKERSQALQKLFQKANTSVTKEIKSIQLNIAHFLKGDEPMIRIYG